jgi:hypothetical protein
MNRTSVMTMTLAAAAGCSAAIAADRAIPVPPVAAMSWEYVTPGTTVNARRSLGVGFWQRASGAKPGVGANYVAAFEYQLPEAPPQRVRSATLQFSGRQSQCAGAEPVVIDVFAYAGNGASEQADSQAGSRVAQLSAQCTDNPAFARPIDVTALVRQLSVAAGVRHVGFNMRKANNRQGPGLMFITPGTLTVVLTDEVLLLPAQAQRAQAPQVAAMPGTMPGAAPLPGVAAAPEAGPASEKVQLLKAFGSIVREASRAARDNPGGAQPANDGSNR